MSQPTAPAANPFDVERDDDTFFVIDTRDGTTADFAHSRDEAESKADRFWYDELKASQVAAEPVCNWCGGDGCKSMMQPAFCLDCVTAMLRDEADTRRDLYGPLNAPDETPSPPALTSCRIALPDGSWVVVDARGFFIGIEQAASAA